MNVFIGGHKLYRFSLMPIDSNMYILLSKNKALIIDPNENIDAFNLIKSINCNEISVILTHEHIDHISGVNMYRDFAKTYGIDYVVYAQEACSKAIKDPNANLSRRILVLYMMRSEEERKLASQVFSTDYMCNADVTFEDKMELNWENLHITLRSTPGHSPGSICIELSNENEKQEAVATGDSLILAQKAITRLPRGNKSVYREKTMPYLEQLNKDVLIMPGHGEMAYMRDFVFE